MGNSQLSPETSVTNSNGLVLDLINSTKVLIFSATYCGYCRVAKRLLDSIGTEFKAVEVDKLGDGGKLMSELRGHTGSNYVPQIFICGQEIGGCDELRKLHESGQLTALLMKCCDGDISCRQK